MPSIALGLHLRRVEGDEDASEGDLHLRVGGADAPGQDLGVGVAGRRQKAQPDEIGLLPAHLLQDHLVGRVRVGLVEHDALVPGALEHRGERHDADGRKPHDPVAPALGALRRGDRVELRVTNVNQEDAHGVLGAAGHGMI